MLASLGPVAQDVGCEIMIYMLRLNAAPSSSSTYTAARSCHSWIVECFHLIMSRNFTHIWNPEGPR